MARIDHFLPNADYASIAEIDRLRKCRLIIASSFVCGSLSLIIPILGRLISGSFKILDANNVPLGILIILNPLILRKTGNVRLASWIFIIGIGLLTSIPNLVDGGLFSPNMVFLTLLPIVTIFFLDVRAGVGVMGGIIVLTGVFYATHGTLSEWQVLAEADYVLIFAITTIVATMLSTAAGYTFQVSQRSATEQMNKTLAQLQAAHEELVVARNEAEAANKAKSEFLANMSHEIRTPLNGVIGMTGLLLDTRQTTEQREFTHTVRNSGEILLSLLNDILDFSKIEAGKIELEESPFNLRHCIEDALDLVTVKADENGVELLLDMAQSIPSMLVGDVTRVRQILLNLLSNAVKFTEQGEIVVSVQAEPLGQSRHRILFCVQDTGIGIPPERVDRLFQTFSQADSSTTRRYGGTGLGLAISKRLTEIMGGTMSVESEVGQGSRFSFSIDMASAPPQATKAQVLHPAELEDLPVLVVDDNATNRTILIHQLNSWGMSPTAVESGEQAIQLLLKGTPFSLVLMDMQMPEMDGLMASKQIRELESCKSLPIILLTSMGQIGKEKYARHKIAGLLTKPIRASQLFDQIMTTAVSNSSHAFRVTDSYARPNPSIKRLDDFNPLRILVAEDNLVNQKVALKMLERMGYRADMAANGQEAIEALRRQSYDLILMDIRMPEMDGTEASLFIRENFPAQQQPKIIAMTAEALQGDRERFLASGMDDYISKPVRPAELARVLKSATSLTRTPAEETPELA